MLYCVHYCETSEDEHIKILTFEDKNIFYEWHFIKDILWLMLLIDIHLNQFFFPAEQDAFLFIYIYIIYICTILEDNDIVFCTMNNIQMNEHSSCTCVKHVYTINTFYILIHDWGLMLLIWPPLHLQWILVFSKT